MKKLLHFSFIAILATSIITTGCDKEDTDLDKEKQDTIDVETPGTDQLEMAGTEEAQTTETNIILTDVGTAIMTTNPTQVDIVGATVDDTTLRAEGKRILIYSGKDELGRTKSGKVAFRLEAGQRWDNKDAKILVEFDDLKVTNAAGKSITFNGSLYSVNITGGLHATNQTPVVTTTVRGQLEISFDNESKRKWHIARSRTYTRISGTNTTTTFKGDTAIDGYDKVATWGVNRKGVDFYSQISTDIVINGNCPGRPVTGTKIHHTGALSKITMVYGVDKTGAPHTSASTCPYGYRIDWVTLKLNQRTVVGSY